MATTDAYDRAMQKEAEARAAMLDKLAAFIYGLELAEVVALSEAIESGDIIATLEAACVRRGV